MKYRKLNDKKILILVYGVIAIAILLIALLLFWWYQERLMGYSPEEATYQIYGDNQFDYDKDTTFYRNEKDTITAKVNGDSVACPDVPIIFVSGDGLAISKDMSLTTGDNAKVEGKLLAFTKLEMGGGSVLFSRNEKNGRTIHGYLYDGEDTYIFLEDTVLTIGNQSYTLGALSYAICTYGEQVEYYNSLDGTDNVVSFVNTDVSAKSETFNIDIGMDIKFDSDGNKALIYNSISKLDEVSMAK